MRAFVVEKDHSSPVLKDLNIRPTNEDDIQVKVLASSINHRDVWITQGLYPGIRYGAVMGSDACVKYGDDEYIINPGINWGLSPSFQSSDFEVLGVPTDGTFSDHIWVRKDWLFAKPAHLTPTQAAAMPLAGVTAFRALMVRGALKPGEKVLISGIGGGVALMAFQLAKAYGASVFVTSGSRDKIERAVDMGAQAGYLYTESDWASKALKESGGIDVVIDGAGGDGLLNFVRLARPGGRIVFYGGTRGTMNGINPQLLFWRQLSILGSTMGSQEDFEAFVRFVSMHQIIPVIDSVLDFKDIPSGFTRMKEGSQFGKIVFDHTIL